MTVKSLQLHAKKFLLITCSFLFIYFLIYAYHKVKPVYLVTSVDLSSAQNIIRVNYYEHADIFDRINKGKILLYYKLHIY